MPTWPQDEDTDPKPWQGLGNEDFRQAIAEAEMSAGQRNGGYQEQNTGPQNALGRYQLTSSALLESKWKIGSQWTDKARAFGVASDEDFKNNPAAQEAALGDVMKDYERQAQAWKLFRHVDQTYIGVSGGPVTISEAGLVAAAHREEAKATSEYLQRRVNGQEADSDRTRTTDRKIEKRLRDFANIPYERGRW